MFFEFEFTENRTINVFKKRVFFSFKILIMMIQRGYHSDFKLNLFVEIIMFDLESQRSVNWQLIQLKIRILLKGVRLSHPSVTSHYSVKIVTIIWSHNTQTCSRQKTIKWCSRTRFFGLFTISDFAVML